MYSTFRCSPAPAPQLNNGGHQQQPTQAVARPLRRTSTANSLPPPEDESPQDRKRKASDGPPVVARDGKDKVDGSKITMNFYHMGNDTYKCCTCNQVIKNTSVHIKNKHSNALFKCENCPSLVLKDQEEFDAHIMDKHPWKIRRVYSAAPFAAPFAPEVEAPPTKRQKRVETPAPRVGQWGNDQGGYYRLHTFDGAPAPAAPVTPAAPVAPVAPAAPAAPSLSVVPVLEPVFNPGRTPPMLFFANFIVFTKDLSIKDRVRVYVRSVPPLLEFARREGIYASKELAEAHFHFGNVGVGLQIDLISETLKDHPSALDNDEVMKSLELIIEEARK